MALFLGIDGGGTGCRAAVADEEGRVLGSGAAGPANIASDPEGARENVLRATRAALAAAGREGVEIGDLHAALGLAGANVSPYAEGLRSALPFASARLVSDAVAAVKGALGTGDGVVAALGTGSVFAAQRGGKVRQIGGWGFLLGDEGSGAWIGRAILARALRAADGFVGMTPLLRGLVEEQGGTDGVVAFALRSRPMDFAALAPKVVGSEDPAALAVMAEATGDVAEAVDLLRGSEDLPVVFLGGLGAAYAVRLSGRWPVRAPLGSALDGALLLAREAAYQS